jgi:hypothetical protein
MINREKYLLPYNFDEKCRSSTYSRRSLNFNYWFYIYSTVENNIITYNFNYFNSGRMKFENLKNAKIALDNILIDNGFILIPENKVEQYKLLM